MARFWDWSLEVYARPGVAEACLDLQDAHGQSVPVLLWAAWAGIEGRALGDDALVEGIALARGWEAMAVGPLRRIRRALRPSMPGIADPAREALRLQVKAAELDAERALMEALEALTPSGGGSSAGLERASAAWGGTAPRAALLDLMARLA